MAPHQLPIVLGQADHSITLRVAEDILAGLYVLPFLGVPDGDLSKLSSVRKDLDICRITEFRIVCCGAEVLEALGLGQRVQLGKCSWQESQQSKGREIHAEDN